ncbi:PAS domain S-box protein [Natronomonas sp. CBA1123]|uniref:PAS domain-containing response regulator n=1 Tax=Natronomonas sp. CBA1123 TaxID=2668070 RepID=UPI0012EA18EE|nr:PAS domain S-box protein [Natronomonas sp. CBA1123]MUV85864.1 PAS domain S-box protein [Natronomonas sp. CBA1123]
MAINSTSATDAAIERPISVACVDDYAELCDLTAEGLESTSGRLRATPITDPEAVTDRLDEFDCIVSDYEMPGTDGLELLRQVRVLDDDIPFILFTSEGSENVASDAISLGVTDYITKSGGSERFTRLAHRIESVVDARRATEQVERTREQATEAIRTERARFRALIEHSPATVCLLDDTGTFQYVSPSMEEVTGFVPRELRGESAFDRVHDEDRERVEREFAKSLSNPDYRPTVEYRFRHKSGDWRYIESRGANRLDDPDIEGFVVNSRDISERRETERRLRRERDLTDRILEVTPAPLLLMERDGHIRRANDRAAEVFGMEREELLGLSPAKPSVTFRNADGEPIADGEYLWEVVAGAGTAMRDVDCEASLPSGDFWLTVSASPMSGEDRTLVVVSVDDIEPL